MWKKDERLVLMPLHENPQNAAGNLARVPTESEIDLWQLLICDQLCGDLIMQPATAIKSSIRNNISEQDFRQREETHVLTSSSHWRLHTLAAQKQILLHLNHASNFLLNTFQPLLTGRLDERNILSTRLENCISIW
jgi:hypothetical protein